MLYFEDAAFCTFITIFRLEVDSPFLFSGLRFQVFDKSVIYLFGLSLASLLAGPPGSALNIAMHQA